MTGGGRSTEATGLLLGTPARYTGAVRLPLLLAVLLLLASPARAQTVQGDEDGALWLQRTRQIVAKLGVTVPRDILLKVRPADEVQVQYISTGGRSISVGGYYQPYNPETIWIVSGQSPEETMASMAHELAHAWQSTEAPLQDRTVVEGFARWVEYKLLLDLGEEARARDLAASPDPDYGEGLRLFLEVERRGGIPEVLKAARTARKPDDLRGR